MKHILLATRPITPPWDEASKNFAYFLGKSISDHHLTLLGTSTPLPKLPNTATVEPVFYDSHLNGREKARLFWFLWKNRNAFDVTHYLFTPTKTNTFLIKHLLLPTKGKTVQTIATLRTDLYHENELKSLLFADKLVVYTDQTKTNLEKLGFHNVSRIYPGIDLTLYQERPKNEAFLQSLGLTREHILAIYPGEYVRLGATDTLTQFCIEYFTKNPDSPLRFVFACRIKNEADARKKSEVQKQLAAAGVEKFVIYTDTVPDMPSLYNLADIVLFPVENLNGKFDIPLVIIEAYACKKPVILSDLGEFREFSGPNICVTIPKGNGEILQEKIDYLVAHPEERTRLGAAARAFVEQNFDLRRTAEEYSSLYSSF